jgi:hypothetical protein
MASYHAKNKDRELKKELVNILMESVHYLDMDLDERNRLLRFLMDSYIVRRADCGQVDS